MASCRRDFCYQLFKSRLAQFGLVFCFLVVNAYLYFMSHKKHSIDGFVSNGARNDRQTLSVNNNNVNVVDRSGLRAITGSEDTIRPEMHIVMPFANVVKNPDIQDKFRICVQSILRHATVFLVFHIVGDKDSLAIADRILQESHFNVYKHSLPLEHFQVVHKDIADLSQRLSPIIRAMQKKFSSKPGTYYGQDLFFISLGLHIVFPEYPQRVVMLDADLRFRADIKDLFAQFAHFSNSQMIGVAAEMQPVYRHIFHEYRARHPGTAVGGPLPNGKPGFNSGVLLLDLKKMRESSLYNSFLRSPNIEALADKYLFRGHLGDQDFFTLVAMEHGELFYRLPCCWNYQLCEWWRDKGYQEVFHQYHNCSRPAKVYHGNCATPIPID